MNNTVKAVISTIMALLAIVMLLCMFGYIKTDVLPQPYYYGLISVGLLIIGMLFADSARRAPKSKLAAVAFFVNAGIFVALIVMVVRELACEGTQKFLEIIS